MDTKTINQEPQTEEVRSNIQMGTKGRKLRVVSKHNGPVISITAKETC